MSYKILLVEDHPIVREGVTMLIEKEIDLVVCGEAEDAPEAFSLALKVKPDLMIVDLDLASSSGLDLVQQIRESQPETKTLILSMHEERIYAERALHAGASGYLMKNEVSRKIISAIRTILDGRLAFSDEVKDRLLMQRMEKKTGQDTYPIERLSKREFQVFQLTGKGLTVKQIAEHLGVSDKTVYKHIERIKPKLNLHSIQEFRQRAVLWVADPGSK